MKKIILGLIALIVIAAGVLFGVNGQSSYDASKYSLSITPENKSFGVDSSIDFILPDQFDNANKLSGSTEKLIFAFSKDMGHEVKIFMDAKPASLLKEKHAMILLDVSPMPTVILNTFAIPDLKKSEYSTLLVHDKNMAKQLRDGLDKNKISVLTLESKRVTKIEYASSKEELGRIIK